MGRSNTTKDCSEAETRCAVLGFSGKEGIMKLYTEVYKMIKYVESIDDFKKAVGEGKVLLDFFAEWCGPCKMLTPVLEEISKKLPDVQVVKCDIDKNQDIASAFKVMSIPTLIYFENGKAVTATAGYLPEPQLMSWIAEAQKKAAE